MDEEIDSRVNFLLPFSHIRACSYLSHNYHWSLSFPKYILYKTALVNLPWPPRLFFIPAE